MEDKLANILQNEVWRSLKCVWIVDISIYEAKVNYVESQWF